MNEKFMDLKMHKLELNRATRSDRKPWSWTSLKKARAADISAVFNELLRWWPLTERQAYYRLISSDRIKQVHWFQHGNTEKSKVDVYKAIGRTLKWMRIDEMLPWRAIIDEHRETTDKRGYSNMQEYINAELAWMFERYNRCMAQKQENYIEIWIEKAALLRIVKPVADKYCRRVVVCKGYNSITFQADFFSRATEAINKGVQPVVLYFGDWDPSGVNMIHAAMQTLADELDLYGVEYHRCGINPEHFAIIPADPVPIKPSDSRSKKFIAQHGNVAYELDAFHPEQLQKLVRNSIEAFTDMSAYEKNIELEDDDREELSDLKEDIIEFIEERDGY